MTDSKEHLDKKEKFIKRNDPAPGGTNTSEDNVKRANKLKMSTKQTDQVRSVESPPMHDDRRYIDPDFAVMADITNPEFKWHLKRLTPTAAPPNKARNNNKTLFGMPIPLGPSSYPSTPFDDMPIPLGPSSYPSTTIGSVNDEDDDDNVESDHSTSAKSANHDQVRSKRKSPSQDTYPIQQTEQANVQSRPSNGNKIIVIRDDVTQVSSANATGNPSIVTFPSTTSRPQPLLAPRIPNHQFQNTTPHNPLRVHNQQSNRPSQPSQLKTTQVLSADSNSISSNSDNGLDYNETELKGKTFIQISTEDFDKPSSPFSSSPSPVPTDSIISTLTSNTDISDLHRLLQTCLQSHDPARQKHLIECMNLDQWSIAGEWFSSKHSEYMKEMTALRRKKRDSIITLEKEIQARYEVVREKEAVIETCLDKLKNVGRQLSGINNRSTLTTSR